MANGIPLLLCLILIVSAIVTNSFAAPRKANKNSQVEEEFVEAYDTCDADEHTVNWDDDDRIEEIEEYDIPRYLDTSVKNKNVKKLGEKIWKEVTDLLAELGMSISDEPVDTDSLQTRRIFKRDTGDEAETVGMRKAIIVQPAETLQPPKKAIVVQPVNTYDDDSYYNRHGLFDKDSSSASYLKEYDLAKQALRIQEDLTKVILKNQIKTDELRELLKQRMAEGKAKLKWFPFSIIKFDKFNMAEFVGKPISLSAVADSGLSIGLLNEKLRLTGTTAKLFLDELLAKAKLNDVGDMKWDLADLSERKWDLADLGVKSFAIADLGKQLAIVDVSKQPFDIKDLMKSTGSLKGLDVMDLAKIGIVDKMDFSKMFVGCGGSGGDALDKLNIGKVFKGDQKFDLGKLSVW